MTQANFLIRRRRTPSPDVGDRPVVDGARHDWSDRPVIKVFPSSLGWMAVAFREVVLQRLTFGHTTPAKALKALAVADAEVIESRHPSDALIDRLQRYADGVRDDFTDVPIDLSGHTDFQRSVLDTCRRIPYGSVMTYGQLAQQAGRPRAARAVGNVMASNRCPIVIPCHRVLGSGGSLGGYSSPAGLEMKQRMLHLEGLMLRMRCRRRPR